MRVEFGTKVEAIPQISYQELESNEIAFECQFLVSATSTTTNNSFVELGLDPRPFWPCKPEGSWVQSM